MQRLQHAFRLHLEHDRGLSTWSVGRYVTAAGHLLTFCERSGFDLERGEVSASLLVEFAEDHDDSRTVRGAALFCRFLQERGVPLPELDALHGVIDLEQVERFFDAAHSLPQPYATLLCLLPLSGLCAEELRRFQLVDVVEHQGALSLRHEGRAIALEERGQTMLRDYLRGWRATAAQGSSLLFPNRTGRPISASTISRKLKGCQGAAELPEFRMTALSDLYLTHFADLPEPESADLPEPESADPMEKAGEEALPSLDGLPPEALCDPLDPLPDDAPSPDKERMPHDDDFDHQGHSGPSPPPSSTSSSSARRSSRRNGTAKEVDRLLPKQGTVYIRHRREDGTVEYCGHYSVMDVAPDGAIEPFLFEHIAPQWGGGEYLVYLKPTADRPRVTVRIATPPRRTNGQANGHGHAAMPGSSPQHSSARVFREAMQVVEDIKQSSSREGGGTASFDIALRLGRLEAKLESLFGSGGPIPFGFADAMPHPHPPWSPTASTAPLPGPDRAEHSVLDIVLEDRRYYRERLELERDRLDKEREKLELERRRQGGSASGNGNPLQNVQETLSNVTSLATAAQNLVNATGGNDDDAKPGSPVQSFVDSFAGAMGKEVTHRMGEWFTSTPRKSSPSTAADGGGTRRKKRAKKKRSNRARQQGQRQQGKPPQIPEEVPSYFHDRAKALDTAADGGPDEAVTDALVQTLASLHMSAQWRPFVDDTCMQLVQDDHEGTLQRLGALLGALVRGGHLREPTAHRVLSIADESWDETRERLLVLFQQYQAQMRDTGS